MIGAIGRGHERRRGGGGFEGKGSWERPSWRDICCWRPGERGKRPGAGVRGIGIGSGRVLRRHQQKGPWIQREER